MPKHLICSALLIGIYCAYVSIYARNVLNTPENHHNLTTAIAPLQKDQCNTVRTVFYNTENLFHPSDDSIAMDEDFTPSGPYHWTYSRYYAKINKIGKLFVAIGEGCLPALIGLCEIENRKVLEDILKKSVMKYHSYKIIHKESPDRRGIDVAILYDPEQFMPLSYDFLNIEEVPTENLKTREILYVSGMFHNEALCHVFVNHWPSRRGGQSASEYKRILAAQRLRKEIDSLLILDPDSNIIIMGDLNDEPLDVAVRKVLKSAGPESLDSGHYLVNLMFPMQKKGLGTHYRVNTITEAAVLDQILVSTSIFKGENGIKLFDDQAHIYRNVFLINKKNGRPLRTYQGLKYLGGFSDHLPVYTDFLIQIKQ